MRISPQCGLIHGGLTSVPVSSSRTLRLDQITQKNQKNPIFVPKNNKQIIQISRHCHFVCLNLSGPSNPVKMVKSRITASRRLRAQVKKHQKTRRGGHNGFSPRLRELNSGDVPWEMPSGGKSKFPKKKRKRKILPFRSSQQQKERARTNLCGTNILDVNS